MTPRLYFTLSLLAARAAAKTCGLGDVYSNLKWNFEKLGECSELDLGYGTGGKQHHLGANEVHLLADAIKSPEVTLQMLSLADDSIGDAGAIELAAALMTNQHLTSLHLGKNLIGDVGALALAQVLSPEQAPNSKLQVLNLVDNPISDGGAAALAESLKFNKVRRRTGSNRPNDLSIPGGPRTIPTSAHPHLRAPAGRPSLHSISETPRSATRAPPRSPRRSSPTRCSPHST